MTTASADRSLRYILPPDAPLVSNLAALWAVDPALAETIELASVEPHCRVETARSGEPTVSYHADGARGVLLHSRYNPRDEASRLVDTVDTNGAMLLFVHGLGLGYHVEELIARAGREATTFVFEPVTAVMRAALEHRDLSKLITSGRLQLVNRADKSDWLARLTPFMAGASLPVVTLRHAPSVQLAGEAHAAAERAIGDFLAYARTSVTTLVVNGRRTAQNILHNLPWYAGSPSLARLHNVHAGEPAIIVSAGPSLRKNKHLLRDAAGRCVLIAVQTTLQPLLELGVRPDFVTSLDYHEISTRFFEKLPADLETELVAEPKASDKVLELFPGPISLLGNEFADSLLSELGLAKTRLRAGATVAHLAFYLAEHLGCDPIIFVGQDLGFSDGLCYTPGTSYEDVWRPELGRFCTVEMKQWEQIVRDRPILRRVQDHAGRPAYTEERLFTYLQQFERDFAATRARVIDATEGGILKRGARPMSLREAIDQYCTRPCQRRAAPHGGLNLKHLPAVLDCLSRRRREAGEIGQISRETLPRLEEIRDHIADQARVNRAIARIDQLRRQLDGLANCYELVTQLTQQSELQRFKTDRAIAAAAGQIDPTERQRRQVMRDIENVSAVGAAAADLVTLMDEAMDRVRRFAARRSGRAA